MTVDGTYEIVEMELWGKKDIDLIRPGYFRITGNTGELHFICVDGQMDIRKCNAGSYKVSWNGNDKRVSACGSGEFAYNGDTLTGRIYVHNGDDTSFVAKKISKKRITGGEYVSGSESGSEAKDCG
jgi:hypothetical protein